ncbi:MAG: PP2C family serine/threonine-protein phosphatase [Bacillota bacterium]|nr:PP2C family serine/threonine-protein phosphatase [Bacillota bacterium]
MSESKIIDLINPEEATLGLNEKAPLPAVVQQSVLPECKEEAPAKEESPDKDKTAQEVEEQPNSDKPKLVAAESKKGLTNKEVTDHTASLWKYLPIPTDEPEPAPEYLQCDTTLPGGRVIAARVRGKKHKHEGTNCDDWFEIANVDDVTFIAVSDGAGSKKFSRIGARESCKASVGYLVSAYGKMLSDIPTLREALKQDLSSNECMEACGRIAGLVQKSVIQAWEAVEAAFYSRATDPAYSKVLKRKLDLKDLSGTLLVAAIIPLNRETKEHLIVTCQVGDGMIVSINSKGTFQSSVKLLGVPDSGDFSGETEFLTAPQMKTMESLQKRTKLSRGVTDTVMLMSDGVADDYFPNETQMRRLFFDLLVNGIIEMEDKPADLSKLTPKEMSIFKRIPDPILYPWVNDKSVTVPIQYTNRICDTVGVSLEELWEDRSILGLASLELKEAIPASDMGERLRVWLDNYYERGSFDDRTLVVMQL